MEHPATIINSLGITPLKKFGQNFLVNNHSLEGVEKYLDNKSRVLEIGPGLGAVTTYFLEKDFKMAASEKDRKISAYLRDHFLDRLFLVEGDFLETDVNIWKEKKITQLVGNLPFYITSPIIVKIIKEMPFIETMVIGVQYDVAEKLVQPKGNSFALFIASQGDLFLHKKIKKNSFFPVPKVDGAWIVWKRNPIIINLSQFEIFLRGLFWGKRKSVSNSLKKNPFFSDHGVADLWLKNIDKLDPDFLKSRPDEISIEDARDSFFKLTGLL